MSVSFNFASSIESALNHAAESLGLDLSVFTPEVRTADPRHGDFQANGVLPYAKRTKQNPRALAEQVVKALPAELSETFTVTIAGPGFLNFTLQSAALDTWLTTYATEAALRAGASATQE